MAKQNGAMLDRHRVRMNGTSASIIEGTDRESAKEPKLSGAGNFAKCGLSRFQIATSPAEAWIFTRRMSLSVAAGLKNNIPGRGARPCITSCDKEVQLTQVGLPRIGSKAIWTRTDTCDDIVALVSRITRLINAVAVRPFCDIRS